jgi:hypothetical protein
VRLGQARHQTDHFVTAPVPVPVVVPVVVGLEMVHVDVAGAGLTAAVEQATNLRADGNVAGQRGERSGVGRESAGDFGPGSAQVVALAVMDIESPDHAQIGFALDALGHQHGAKDIGNLQQCPQGIELVGVVIDVAAVVLVDLDNVGPYLRPQAKAGTPVAKVAQRQRATDRVQHTRHLHRGIHIEYTLVLDDVQHYHARQHNQAAHELRKRQAAASFHRARLCRGADVEQQATRLTQFTPTAHGRVQAE